MNRSKFHVFGIILLVFAAGCSSTITPPPVTYPQVSYVKGTSYIYYAQNLDANTGLPSPGTGDTITSKVLTTDTTYQGMSNVTVIQNTHTHPVSMDTTYIAQSNGNVWHYNFGLEALNKNGSVLAFNNQKPVIAGWVLQAKLTDDAGGTWLAADTTITLGSLTPTLIDSVTESSDTTVGPEFYLTGTDSITVDSLSSWVPKAYRIAISTKHSVHIVNINAPGVADARGPVDTYFSAQYGQVLNIFHPTTIGGQFAPGQVVVLIQAP